MSLPSQHTGTSQHVIIMLADFKRSLQGFSLTEEGLLRTTLHCVVVKNPGTSVRPTLEDCVMGSRDKWRHLEVG